MCRVTFNPLNDSKNFSNSWQKVKFFFFGFFNLNGNSDCKLALTTRAATPYVNLFSLFHCLTICIAFKTARSFSPQFQYFNSDTVLLFTTQTALTYTFTLHCALEPLALSANYRQLSSLKHEIHLSNLFFRILFLSNAYNCLSFF